MRYVTAAILIVLVVTLLAFAMPLVPWLVVLICMIGVWEMCTALKTAKQPAIRWLALAVPPLLLGGYQLLGVRGAATALAGLVLATTATRVFRPKLPLSAVTSTLSTWLYPTLPLLSIAVLAMCQPMEKARALLILAITASAVSDTAAMFGGMLLGRHKLCPAVSPKKTVEGFIASFVGGAAGATAAGWIILNPMGVAFEAVGGVPPLVWMCLFGLISAGVTALGDLSASAYKRAAGIKDFGNLLPGHGGILDRLDGIMWSSCALLLLTVWLGW